jgi:hypothetical protein
LPLLYSSQFFFISYIPFFQAITMSSRELASLQTPSSYKSSWAADGLRQRTRSVNYAEVGGELQALDLRETSAGSVKRKRSSLQQPSMFEIEDEPSIPMLSAPPSVSEEASTLLIALGSPVSLPPEQVIST